MKNIFLLSVAISTALLSAANAETPDAVSKRLNALEQEISAVKRENAALRQLTKLKEENAELKASGVAPSRPAVASAARKSDPFAAYAADLPLAYKAAPIGRPRQFKIWGEGGAIWSGGDTNTSAYTLGSGTLLFGGLGGPAGVFDLNPKVGWEGAGGFDYRFTNSDWHVSGQFRYGESGKANGAASFASAIDPAALGGGGGGLVSVNASDALATSYQERHWIADLAVGKELTGEGPDALQVKGGLRVSEFIGKTETLEVGSAFATLAPGAAIGGIPISSIASSTTTASSVRGSFLGAGPLIGVDGSIPLTKGWMFDYTGDAAILFGTQKTATTTSTNSVITPAILGLLGVGSTSNAFTNERFASVFSADLQVGVSYWVTENLKLGLSYRMDAMINVQNQDASGVTNLTPDRYTHGPRVRLTGQF
jgi:hypothetical protein